MTNPHPRDLNSVTEAWLAVRAVDCSDKTVASSRKTMRQLMATTGNIQVGSLEVRHMDTFRVQCKARGNGGAQLNQHRSHLRMFCTFVRQRRTYGVSRDWDPMIGWRQERVLPSKKLLIPPTEFPRLLDAATHPRDRMVVATGLYLFLRASETTGIKIEDVDLDRDEIGVTIWKTKQRDLMPVCEELSDELRRYLTWYSKAAGPLQPAWYLVPRRARPTFKADPVTGRAVVYRGDDAGLKPTERFSNVAYTVQRALDACGYGTYWEGGHTLRRSGARALYD